MQTKKCEHVFLYCDFYITLWLIFIVNWSFSTVLYLKLQHSPQRTHLARHGHVEFTITHKVKIQLSIAAFIAKLLKLRGVFHL